jgi:hypothetical protein
MNEDKKQKLLTDPGCKSIERLLSEFEEWLTGVAKDGIPIQSMEFYDFNENGDGLIRPEAREYFEKFVKEDMPIIGNLKPYERWIPVRHMLSNIFQVYNFGDIDGDENVKREIRKSIIIGLTYSNNRYEF